MRLNRALITVLAAASLCAGTAHADLVSNGGFETGDFTGWTQGGNTDFTTVENTSDIPSHSGTFSASMGPVGSDGTLAQVLPTAVGASYQLSYWLSNDSGSTPNDFSATIGSSSLFPAADIALQGFTQYIFSFVGTGSDTLTFAFRNDPGFFGLDDVSVVQASAVPEPATFALLSLSLAGLGFSRRRKPPSL